MIAEQLVFPATRVEQLNWLPDTEFLEGTHPIF
jgi:hypothetical protein